MDYAYYGHKAQSLYDDFVKELNAKIINGYLHVGSLQLLIKENYNNDSVSGSTQIFEKNVRYLCQGFCNMFSSLKIKMEINMGRNPKLKIMHFAPRNGGLFDFPLNDSIVQQAPILFFNKWIEVVTNGRPYENQAAEFDHYLKTYRNFPPNIAGINAVSRREQDIRDPEVLKLPPENHPHGWWAIATVFGDQDLLRKIHYQGFEKNNYDY
jgi:hypothetical protein